MNVRGSVDNLSLEERERRLSDASAKYIRKEISNDQLKEAESQYSADYETAALEISSIRQQAKYVFGKFISSLSKTFQKSNSISEDKD